MTLVGHKAGRREITLHEVPCTKAHTHTHTHTPTNTDINTNMNISYLNNNSFHDFAVLVLKLVRFCYSIRWPFKTGCICYSRMLPD